MLLMRFALIALMVSCQLWGQNARLAAGGQVRIPNRASTPLFKGPQGKQKSEIYFDPATSTVTIKLLVQDPSGYFIPNLRRNNFVVYENGVPQKNATVEIEHAPVTLGLLLEYGGRYPGLNKVLSEKVSGAAEQLLDDLGRDDKLIVWKYADTLEQLVSFSQSLSQSGETLRTLFYELKPPGVSEANLYDALISVLGTMRPVAGRWSRSGDSETHDHVHSRRSDT
jgi:hypothetical protein